MPHVKKLNSETAARVSKVCAIAHSHPIEVLTDFGCDARRTSSDSLLMELGDCSCKHDVSDENIV